MKTALMLAILTVLACGSKEQKQETGDRRPATGDGRRRDKRSQRDLANEIAGAEKMRRDDADAAYDRIRTSWLGKRVMWTVDVVPALCRSAESCHALAFDRLGADRAVVQGWMPRLRLDQAGFAALEARCAGRARCSVTVAATVAELTLSTDEPTSLTLADVLVAPSG
jgi:hypothetical protein